jgi:hypothetical protein
VSKTTDEKAECVTQAVLGDFVSERTIDGLLAVFDDEDEEAGENDAMDVMIERLRGAIRKEARRFLQEQELRWHLNDVRQALNAGEDTKDEAHALMDATETFLEETK